MSQQLPRAPLFRLSWSTIGDEGISKHGFARIQPARGVATASRIYDGHCTVQARTRAVIPQQSQGQPSQEGSMAAGAAQQSSGAADAEQQDDSVSRIEQESRELQQGSRAADNLDVRWSERLVLELPPDTEEDEARPYATLCWIPVLSQHHTEASCEASQGQLPSP